MIKQTKRTAKVITALTARTQFGQIMRRASQKNQRFLVDRRGEPAVIIMSVNDYNDTIAPPTRIRLSNRQKEAKSMGLNKMSMRQIDAEIAAAMRAASKGT